LHHGIISGVWGGTTEDERRALRRPAEKKWQPRFVWLAAARADSITEIKRCRFTPPSASLAPHGQAGLEEARGENSDAASTDAAAGKQ
jgi:hypothetical protein